ncbi:hypothetical protein BJ944DRAFT_240068, partial [Cunninghamella echinulata]
MRAFTLASAIALLSLTSSQDVFAFPAGNTTITAWAAKQADISISKMFSCINPPGTAK